MAVIARPPCDEAAILATVTDRPTAGQGRWVLAATILGSSLAFIDSTVVNVALPGLAVCARRDVGRRAMGRRIVRAHAGGAAPDRRIAGRSARPPQGLCRRRVPLRRRLGVVRPFPRRLASSSRLAPCRASAPRCSFPGSLSLISASFPAAERGRAIGTWSGFTAITAAVGPVLGGWLVQHLSWRWVFFINLPARPRRPRDHDLASPGDACRSR